MLHESVRQSLFRLPKGERQQLGVELLDSVDREEAEQADVDTAWRDVVHQRAHDILAGTTETVDAFEAIDEMLADLQVTSS